MNKSNEKEFLWIDKNNKLLENPVFPEKLEKNVLDYFK